MSKTAKYKILQDGSYFGEIPEAPGVWANAKTLKECKKELKEVFIDWLKLNI
jgi:predicted RNase H-like HicB family nuclease